MHASWPVAGDIDELILLSSEYLMNFAHELRIRIKNRITMATKKSKVRFLFASDLKINLKMFQGQQVEAPDKAVVFVAKSYPEWQQVTIDTLRFVSH